MSIPPTYVPLDARGWRMTMGLRPLDPARWLEIDAHRDEELALKKELLIARRGVVVATRPEGDDASEELLGEVLAWFASYAPALSLPRSTREHPVVAAARLVQEDLCVLTREDAWRLQAACVCFPSRWSLATKIGRTMDQIHEPVPGFEENLSGPTNAVFDRLRVDKPFWRLNWTVIDDPTLHQPDAARPLVHDDLAKWYFRVERQTIRRLPETRAVVFTIHNYVTSVLEMCAMPEFTEHLLLGIESAPQATKRYKGWVDVAHRLREELA